MEYRFLGESGLKVSILSFGTWLYHDLKDQEKFNACFIKCIQEGINFFDTSESYGNGNAEIILGNSIKKFNIQRDSLVISSKIFFGASKNNIQTGLSRKHIWEGTCGSLERLQTNYIDIMYAHRYDNHTNMEEICRGFNQLIKKGKILYWGTSEWNINEIQKAFQICDRLNLIKPIVEQTQYNLFLRDRVELEFKDFLNDNNFGIAAACPLLGGILTGKYLDEIPVNSRLSKNDPFLKSIYDRTVFNENIISERIEQISFLKEFSSFKFNCTMSQLCLSWLLKNKNLSTAIMGATQPSQIEENVKSIKIYKEISKELLEVMEVMLKTRPQERHDWRNTEYLLRNQIQNLQICIQKIIILVKAHL